MTASLLPPVLAVPGAVSGPAPLAAALEEIFPGREIHVIDPLAFAVGDEVNFSTWTRDFLDAIPKGSPALLFGYSMGARLALHALRADPSRWVSAVLVSGHPGLANAEEKAARAREDETWVRRAESDPWSQFLAEWEARPVFQTGIPPRDWKPSLARSWEEDRLALEARRAVVASSLRAWSLGQQGDFHSFLSQCSVPITWVTGALDEKFTRLGRELAATCPCITHTIVPGVGHRVPWEDTNGACLGSVS
ncbi:MAG: alpha/beta fold hydrolase [Verrucomicrobiales bacterium]